MKKSLLLDWIEPFVDLAKRLKNEFLIFSALIILVLTLFGLFKPQVLVQFWWLFVLFSGLALIAFLAVLFAPALSERIKPKPAALEKTPAPKLFTPPEVKQPQPCLDPPALRERYLRTLLAQCMHLHLTMIDRKAATRQEVAELDLAAVFTALDVYDVGERHKREPDVAPEMAQGEVERRRSALTVISRYPRLTLLGDPGAGKSTLINFITLCLAGEHVQCPDADRRRLGDAWALPPLLPLRVILRDYAARGLPAQKGLWDFLGAEAARRDPMLAGLLPALEPALKQKDGALLLLDGLDEVPEAHKYREQLKATVEQFALDFPHCRIVLTSRPYAYQDVALRPDGFDVRRLAPFSPEQIEAFITRWYTHLGLKDPAFGPETAARYAKRLVHEVQRNPRLADLATSPLLLTLMVSLHRWREGGGLPEKRQELYEESVRLLLDLWQRPKQLFNAEGRPTDKEYDAFAELGIGQEALRRALNCVAYEAHKNQPALTGTHDIRAGDLAGVLYEAADKGKVSDQRRVIQYLTDRAGLLIEREQGRIYTFPHRTFQEYLAACHLANNRRELYKCLRVDDARWREAMLLAAAKAVGGSTDAIWDWIATFCPTDAPPGAPARADWYAALRVAQALQESELYRNVQEAYQKQLLARLQTWLLALLETNQNPLPASERAAAGQTLGALGDPRFAGALCLPEFIPLPGGEFWMGSTEEEVARIVEETGEDWAKRELPRHRVYVDDFALAKYPTTNAMFARFREDGGYQNPAWWWGVPESFWRGDGTVKDWVGDVRTQPRYWNEERLNGANQPVVGVSWYEVVAYCRWLTMRLNDGHVYRLPTEAEWERAARGREGRRYAWENDWEQDRANTEELNLERTTPVGLFPAGATPEGLLDMTGNVREWCSDWFDAEEYARRAGSLVRNPQGPEEGSSKVLRGGSWYNGASVVRCADRGGIRPVGYIAVSSGFRVARGSLK